MTVKFRDGRRGKLICRNTGNYPLWKVLFSDDSTDWYHPMFFSSIEDDKDGVL